MMDLERLDEAIEIPLIPGECPSCGVIQGITFDPSKHFPTCRIRVSLDAARAYRDLLANGEQVDVTEHLCGEIHEDEIGFYYAECTCGEYRTMPVPDRELVVDELMAHAARSAVSKLLVDFPDLTD